MAPCMCPNFPLNCDCPYAGICNDDCNNQPLSATTTPSDSIDTFVDTQETFTCTASGGTAPYTFQWDFDQGNPAASSNASESVKWSKTGTYTATVVVTDSVSATVSKSITVNVNKLISETWFGPEPLDRLKVGVCEWIRIKTEGPTPFSSFTFDLTGAAFFDDLSNASTSKLLKIKDKAGSVTVTAKVNNSTSQPLSFTVVGPSSLTAQSVTAEPARFGVGDNYAGMFVTVAVEPRDVSFRFITVREWNRKSPPYPYNHSPGDTDIPIKEDNILQGPDHCSHGNTGAAVNKTFQWECDFTWSSSNNDQATVVRTDFPDNPVLQHFDLEDIFGAEAISIDKFHGEAAVNNYDAGP